ncbi:FAM171 family protein [Sphingobacterium bovistauri]|uniref:DUF5689 domain-containing protein n=1 Tax=Sphingobacterium bovistauri TaxID=2781959 RepID=A0ABS7Z093_9SPHI|nr:FAM171 family protein [Sphingobacterium bovistauri]MCA5003593.1 hypothetical protein [Sphingobacterium bovistauri]
MKISTKYILLTLVAIASAVFYTCKNPFDGIEVLADSNIYGNTPTGVVFINANSSNPTPIGDFNVTISGTNADKVINDIGKKEFKVVGGMLSLALQEGVKPTKAAPIQFHISAVMEGYVPISQTITLTHDSLSVHMVKMVQLSNLPAGTAAVVANSTTLSGNVTTEEKTFSLPSTTAKPESAAIALQTGTQFLSQTGAPLTGGAVTSNIVQFSATNSAAVQAIPGGLSAQNLVDQNGNKINAGSFVTAGLLAIDMKVGNQSVKNFSKPLQVDMEVSNSIINPTTGAALKVGDQIPVWSLDEDKGVWKRESTSTVINKNGKLVAPFEVPHLSYWSLNFLVENCAQTTTLTVNANAAAANREYELRVLNQNGQLISGDASRMFTFKSGANTITLEKLPNSSVKIEVIETASKTKVAESASFNPCSGQPAAITLNASTVDLVNVKLDLTGKCPAKSTTVLPTATISLYKMSGTSKEYVSVVRIENGVGNLQLINNTKYFIEITFDGKKYASEFDFKKSDTALPAREGLVGQIKYDASTNSSTLVATFNVPNCN